MLFMERKYIPWFWLGWVPRGPAGSLRFARAHSELHSGEVSIHPLKDRVTKRKPQRHLSEAAGEKAACSIIPAAEARCSLKDQLDSSTVLLLSLAVPWLPLWAAPRAWRPIGSWSLRAHHSGEALEGRTPSPGLAVEIAGTHLGPCFYLGPAVQQEPHHDHVPPAGGDVQWRDAILEGRNKPGQAAASFSGKQPSAP